MSALFFHRMRPGMATQIARCGGKPLPISHAARPVIFDFVEGRKIYKGEVSFPKSQNGERS